MPDDAAAPVKVSLSAADNPTAGPTGASRAVKTYNSTTDPTSATNAMETIDNLFMPPSLSL
jgi:hypothetical protein